MQTHQSAELLITVAEDAPDERCEGEAGCQNEAVWHLYMYTTCDCASNPCPLCNPCKEFIEGWLPKYGPDDWQCVVCGCMGSFDRFERIPR